MPRRYAGIEPMCSGEPSDSVSVLKSRSKSPAPISCDSRMIDENDMRYSTCPISSAIVCIAPLITCKVTGSTRPFSMVSLLLRRQTVDMDVAVRDDPCAITRRHERRRIALHDDRGTVERIAGEKKAAVVTRRVVGFAVVEGRAAHEHERAIVGPDRSRRQGRPLQRRRLRYADHAHRDDFHI